MRGRRGFYQRSVLPPSSASTVFGLSSTRRGVHSSLRGPRRSLSPAAARLQSPVVSSIQSYLHSSRSVSCLALSFTSFVSFRSLCEGFLFVPLFQLPVPSQIKKKSQGPLVAMERLLLGWGLAANESRRQVAKNLCFIHPCINKHSDLRAGTKTEFQSPLCRCTKFSSTVSCTDDRKMILSIPYTLLRV